jgi:ribonuclease P protein component
MTDQRFLPQHHIRKGRDFQQVYKSGYRQHSSVLTLCILENGLTYSRLGLSVSRRYGRAHERNLFKRRLREIFRQQDPPLNLPVDIVIIPGKAAKSADFAKLQEDFDQLTR